MVCSRGIGNVVVVDETGRRMKLALHGILLKQLQRDNLQCFFVGG